MILSTNDIGELCAMQCPFEITIPNHSMWERGSGLTINIHSLKGELLQDLWHKTLRLGYVFVE